MTERLIQNELWKKFNRTSFKLACSNYTPGDWFECDLYAVTKADFGIEYEIKITRKDFFDDKKKTAIGKWQKLDTGWGRGVGENKHAMLAAHTSKGPNRFYYVVPEDLVAVDEVPAWAGLIYIGFVPATHYSEERYSLREVRKAPTLHKEKVKSGILDHMKGVFYWRFWNLRTKQKEHEHDRPSEAEIS